MRSDGIAWCKARIRFQCRDETHIPFSQVCRNCLTQVEKNAIDIADARERGLLQMTDEQPQDKTFDADMAAKLERLNAQHQIADMTVKLTLGFAVDTLTDLLEINDHQLRDAIAIRRRLLMERLAQM